MSSIPAQTTNSMHLFTRDGVYYVRVVQPAAGVDEMEIALHGITSEEKAREAVKVITGTWRSEPGPETHSQNPLEKCHSAAGLSR